MPEGNLHRIAISVILSVLLIFSMIFFGSELVVWVDGIPSAVLVRVVLARRRTPAVAFALTVVIVIVITVALALTPACVVCINTRLNINGIGFALVSSHGLALAGLASELTRELIVLSLVTPRRRSFRFSGPYAIATSRFGTVSPRLSVHVLLLMLMLVLNFVSEGKRQKQRLLHLRLMRLMRCLRVTRARSK